MRKLLRLLCLLIIVSPSLAKAQNQPSAEYFQNLLKKNAAAIGIAEKDLSNWRISDAHFDKHANAMFVYLQQTYSGIDIDKAVNSLSFKSERFVAGNLELLKDLKSLNKNAAPAIDAKTALLNAAANLNAVINGAIIPLRIIAESHTYIFNQPGISFNQIPVKLLWLRNDENNLQLVWQIIISANDDNALWQINIDAVTGRVVSKVNLTVYEKPADNLERRHNVYVYEDNSQPVTENSIKNAKTINSATFNVIAYPNESPLTADPGLITNPWTQNGNQDANTLKWNSTNSNDFEITRGNNVYVQDDHDKKNTTFGFAPKSATAAPNLNFDFVPDFSKEPDEDTITESFGLTNLFYWTNLMHDLSYQYGFDEASGNFQDANLGRGGQANDFAIEDAQDADATDNANFSTPGDGSSPRMQMYLWSHPSFDRDFYVNLPVNFAGYHRAPKDGISNKNSFKTTGPIVADVVYFNDNAGGTTHLGCNAAANASDLKNKIAYIDRGTCLFAVKIKNAQTAGASGIIVGNYSGIDSVITMGGTDNTIKIPGVLISGLDADSIKKYLDAFIVVNATLYGPQIDGEIDNTIPTHEYTHGISNRLVGGPQNIACLRNAEEMGEGWSDWYALMITQNWPASSVTGDHIRKIGNYAVGFDSTYPGIRVYPYSTNLTVNPWTYDSLTKIKPILGQPDSHTIGEIWCNTLWNLTWQLVKSYGVSNNIFDAAETGGNNIALSLITQGMKLTKCSPGFVDARNGILNADTLLYAGKYSKEIWIAFAGKGLGYSASQGSSNNNKDGVPAYDLPPNILPVAFGSFTAQKQGNTSLLKWTTVQESNSDKFVVERSTNGNTYSSVGTINAAGYSGVQKSYQLIDPHPVNGNNIYRIKEFDKDGRFNLSDLRSLNFADIKPYIKISPNPANNIVTINIPGNNQELTIKLLSNAGQLVSNKILTGETLTFDVSKFAAGVYNITIDGKGYSVKYKLVIQ